MTSQILLKKPRSGDTLLPGN